MKTWRELEFVRPVEEEMGGLARPSVRNAFTGQAGVSVLQHQLVQRSGWEEIVFEVADDDALD